MPLINCSVENTQAALTVGVKVKLICKTDVGLSLTPTSKIEFRDLSPTSEHALVFLDQPVIGGNQVEQFITSYRAGTHEFTGIKLIIDNKEHSISKQTLTVGSVLPQESKQAPTPFPIYDPKAVPAPWWWWALWGVLLLLIVGFCVREFLKWNKKRKAKLSNKGVGKPQTPQEKFQTLLRKLDSKGLPSKGEFKAFALELTHILKTTIGEHYRFNAEDMTSEELNETLQKRHKVFYRDSGELLQNMLADLDQIKFAKVETTPEKCFSLLDQANRVGLALFGLPGGGS